jgi:hypothetical protein
MRKIAGKIAMILVLVMIANSFSGCTLMYLAIVQSPNPPEFFMICVLIDVLAVGYGILELALSSGRSRSSFLGMADSLSEDDYNAVREKLDSLPEAELASLVNAINSLPEAEKVSLMERINSLTEEEFVSLARAFYTTPDMEIVSSIRKMNSFTESQFGSFVNVLQHVDLGFSPEESKAYVGVRFRY